MEGFHFACQRGCTRCCEVPGVVRLTANDIEQAAAYLGLEQAAFTERYVLETADARFLHPQQGTRCPFLDADGCAIHEAKPLQCRLYPFWPEVVETRQSWQRTVELCPGMGKGEFVRIQTAVERAQEMKRAFPECYTE